MRWKIDENEELPLAIIEDTKDGEGVAEIGERTERNLAIAIEIVTAHNLAAPVAPVSGNGPEPPETEVLKMALDLIATDELFVNPAEGGGWVFWVNVNDMFYPAADGEGIDFAEIPSVWKAWKESGWPGVVRWVQEKRGGLPLRKSREETIHTMENLQKRVKELEAGAASHNGQGWEDLRLAAELLEFMYDKWENGDPSFSESGDSLGNAFQLGDREDEIISVLNRLFPRRPLPAPPSEANGPTEEK